MCSGKDTVKYRIGLIFLFLLVNVGKCELFAIGLSTRFADIVLERMPAGQPYNLRVSKDLPYKIKNNSDEPTRVEIHIEQPKKILAEGYEPIPDPTWIRVVPNEFTLGGAEESYSDLIILVPEDEIYQGRHYQASIIANGISASAVNDGVAFGCALASRIRFSVGTVGPEALQSLKRRNLLLELDFDLTPTRMHLMEITIGNTFDLKKEEKPVLKIVNRGSKKLKFNFRSVKVESKFTTGEDYEPAPEPGWLKFKRSTKKVGSNKIKDVEMIFDIPEKEEYRDKRYMFVVRCGIEDYDVPVEVFSRIFVVTK